MSYNFRLCITKNESNKVPFEKPGDYSVEEFDVLSRYLAIEPDHHQLAVQWCPGRRRQPGCGMFIMSDLPNGKVLGKFYESYLCER